jgi:hypothetical protein
MEAAIDTADYGAWRRFLRYMRIRGMAALSTTNARTITGWTNYSKRLAMRVRIERFDYVAGSIVQRIFRSASRRETLGKHSKVVAAAVG